VIFLLALSAYTLGVDAKQMSTTIKFEKFSIKEIVEYKCVKTIGSKFENLLCSALKGYLQEKNTKAQSDNNKLANGIHIRLSLETVTQDSISGWMEWKRCKNAECSSWIKTGVIQTIVMDSAVSSSTYKEFIIGLFIYANKSSQMEER
tara:strand:- start:63 stop:506 length:444 start_codon:yes stop_codon:yes gene_type:complete